MKALFDSLAETFLQVKNKQQIGGDPSMLATHLKDALIVSLPPPPPKKH